MPRCSFCSKMYDVPHGLTFVLPNGDVLYFCCSKCHKNWKMGRKNQKIKWVKKQKKTKSSEKTKKAEKPAENKKE